MNLWRVFVSCTLLPLIKKKKFSLGSLSFFSARKSKWRSYLSSCRVLQNHAMKRHALGGQKWKRTHFRYRNRTPRGEAPCPPSQPRPWEPSQKPPPRGQCSLSTWVFAPWRHPPSPPLPGAPTGSPSALSLDGCPSCGCREPLGFHEP